MKRLLLILLALLVAVLPLSGCDRRSDVPEADAGAADFAPETTAVGGLTQAVEEQSAAEESGAPEEEATAIPADTAEPTDTAAPTDAEPMEPAQTGGDAASEQPVAQDEAASAEPSQSPTPTSESPFATPTPQPNASVSQYTEVSVPGLGFRFSYPSNWVNIPGRSTACYVQPIEEGTVYPARVAVTMKRMPHKSSFEEARTELANYLRTLMTQYDASTFQVDMNLDTATPFMGNNAMGTTYLAYDGDQEIKGYAVITYFERYLFVYHFLCAYNDYDSFEPTMRYMRDSVQADASVAPEE